MYLRDHWRGHIDEELYKPFKETDEVDLKVILIPEQTTDQLQPLDTFFHRELKLLVRTMYSHCKLFSSDNYTFMTTRNGNLITQSLAHFVLKSPKFYGMIRRSWFKAGLLDSDVEFSNVNDVCFNFGNKSCESSGCGKIGFIRCPWCDKILCYEEFYKDYHIMQCHESPYLSHDSLYGLQVRGDCD